MSAGVCSPCTLYKTTKDEGPGFTADMAHSCCSHIRRQQLYILLHWSSMACLFTRPCSYCCMRDLESISTVITRESCRVRFPNRHPCCPLQGPVSSILCTIHRNKPASIEWRAHRKILSSCVCLAECDIHQVARTSETWSFLRRLQDCRGNIVKDDGDAHRKPTCAKPGLPGEPGAATISAGLMGDEQLGSTLWQCLTISLRSPAHAARSPVFRHADVASRTRGLQHGRVSPRKL